MSVVKCPDVLSMSGISVPGIETRKWYWCPGGRHHTDRWQLFETEQRQRIDPAWSVDGGALVPGCNGGLSPTLNCFVFLRCAARGHLSFCGRVPSAQKPQHFTQKLNLATSGKYNSEDR